jgi:hypothetical protein
MAGRRKWSDIRAGASEETRESAECKTAALLRDLQAREKRQDDRSNEKPDE